MDKRLKLIIVVLTVRHHCREREEVIAFNRISFRFIFYPFIIAYLFISFSGLTVIYPLLFPES